MNKTQLIAAISEETEISKPVVKELLETFESVVIETCKKGEPVMLTGFVKFARVDRAARMGRNPATGEAIKIKAKSVAKATPLKGFKDAVLASAPKPPKEGGTKKKGKKKSKKK